MVEAGGKRLPIRTAASPRSDLPVENRGNGSGPWAFDGVALPAGRPGQINPGWPGGIEQLAMTDLKVRQQAVDELAKRATEQEEDLLLELFSDSAPLAWEISLRTLQEVDGTRTHFPRQLPGEKRPARIAMDETGLQGNCIQRRVFLRALLKLIYEKNIDKEGYRSEVPKFYWTIRIMSGRKIVTLRKQIRDEVGMVQLR